MDLIAACCVYFLLSPALNTKKTGSVNGLDVKKMGSGAEKRNKGFN